MVTKRHQTRGAGLICYADNTSDPSVRFWGF